MASSVENVTSGITLSDEISILTVPTRSVETVLDSVPLLDTVVITSTQRPIESISEGVALGDTVILTLIIANSESIEDNIILSDSVNIVTTIRNEITIPENLPIVDSLSIASTNRNTESVSEFLGLLDEVVIKSTQRVEETISEPPILIVDTLIQQWGIVVIGGTGSGSYDAGEIVPISATIPFNHVFVRWVFNKMGIDNIYSPDTNLTVPLGGGVITAEFFNLGTILVPFNSTVIILTLNDFKYVEDVDGDRIDTEETVKVVGNSMGVAVHNFTIEQGSVFNHIIIYRDADGNPVDLTGFTATMQIRQTKEASSVIQELSTSNGFLVLGGVNGTITINLPADVSDALDFVWGRYDLELYPNGDTTQAVRLVEGKINLSKQVTQ